MKFFRKKRTYDKGEFTQRHSQNSWKINLSRLKNFLWIKRLLLFIFITYLWRNSKIHFFFIKKMLNNNKGFCVIEVDVALEFRGFGQTSNICIQYIV